MQSSSSMLNKRKRTRAGRALPDTSVDVDIDSDEERPSYAGRYPALPSPIASDLSGVSLDHQLKREETLRRTLSSSTSGLPLRGPSVPWFPLHPRDHRVAPLTEMLDYDRRAGNQRVRDSEDENVVGLMTDRNGNYDHRRSPPLSQFSSRALASRHINQSEVTVHIHPNHRQTSPSRQLPPIDRLLARHQSDPATSSGYHRQAIGQAEHEHSYRTRPPSVPQDSDKDSPSPRSYEETDDESVDSQLQTPSFCAFNVSPPTPQFHSRFLHEQDARKEPISSASLRRILEPFSTITLSGSPESVQGALSDEDSSGSDSLTPSSLSPPQEVRTFSEPVSPAPRLKPLPLSPTAYGLTPGTHQWRTEDKANAAHAQQYHRATSLRPESNPREQVSDVRPNTLRIKDEWKNHTEVLRGPQDATLFKCLWATGSIECGYTAKRHLVKRHVETRHLQIKDHICPTCGKAFPQRNSLQIHLNRHTGETPHACRYDCGMSFNDPARRHKHMVDVHGYNPQGPRKRHRTVDSYHDKSPFEAIAPWSVKPESA